MVASAAAWNATPTLALAAVAFELIDGLLILWRGPFVRLALAAAAAWGLGMLPGYLVATAYNLVRMARLTADPVAA